MKKTVKMMGMAILLGAVAFLGSSCKKNTPATSIKVSLPVVDELSIDGEKAYIDFNDGNLMKWNSGDEIMFYNLFEDYKNSVTHVYTIYNGIGAHLGDFNGDEMGDERGEWGYYAFYPAAKVKNYPLQPGNRQYFDVPGRQIYNKTSMDPTTLVMAAHGDHIMTGNFEMKHIYGFIDMRLKGTKAVKEIIIRDNFFNLNGRISAKLPYVDESILSTLIGQCADYTVDFDNYMVALQSYLNGDLGYMSEPQGNDMTLDCSANGGVQLKASTYTDFYITLRPGALAKGFVVEVKYMDGNSDIIRKFDPTATGSWAYSAYPQYPRGFCVRPGVLLKFKGN